MTRESRSPSGSRGISTVVDVAIGLLLVSAAVSVIAGINPPADNTPETSGSVLLGSRVDVQVAASGPETTVTGTMGGMVGDAVLAGQPPVTARDRAFRRAVRAAVERRISETGVPIQVIGYCRGGAAAGAGGDDGSMPSGQAIFVAGADTPPERPIRAVVYDVPGGPATGTPSGNRDCEPAVVVRRWSP